MIKNIKLHIIQLVLCNMDKKLHEVPINLIKKTGNQVFDIPDGHLCCGSAGTYNLLQSDIAKKLLKNKISNIEKINPQFILQEILVVLLKLQMAQKFQFYIQLKLLIGIQEDLNLKF